MNDLETVMRLESMVHICLLNDLCELIFLVGLMTLLTESFLPIHGCTMLTDI